MSTIPVKPKPRRATIERPRTLPEINEFRRKALIEGCIESMAEYGIGGTTVKTICEAAGASRGLISHYFDSKDDLVAAALKHLYARVAENVALALEASGSSAVDKLHALPGAIFTPPVFNEQNLTAFLGFWHEVRFNDAVRVVNSGLYDAYIQRIENLFADAAVELGKEIDARQAALGIIVLCDGLWLSMSIHDKIASPEEAIEIGCRYIDRELGIA